MYATDEQIFTEYVTNTLLTMGFTQHDIKSILPDLTAENKAVNGFNAIDRAVELLNNPTAPEMDEEEEKEAIIRQKELHFIPKPISSAEIIANNPDLKRIKMQIDKSNPKLNPNSNLKSTSNSDPFSGPNYDPNSAINLTANDNEYNPTAPETMECIICLDDKSEDEFWKNSCEHPDGVCTECAFTYFRENILNGKVEIFCLYPGCPEFIPEAEILKVIQSDPDLTTKYGVYEMNLRLSRNANIRWCPQPKCQQTTVVLDNSDPCYRSKIQCDSCGIEFCAECTQKWHEGQTCQQAMSHRVKPCPSCNAGLVKMEKTNHMICHCRYEFCWICQGKWTPNHYAPWNVCGCPGGEVAEQRVSVMNRSIALLAAVLCAPCLVGSCLCDSQCNTKIPPNRGEGKRPFHV